MGFIYLVGLLAAPKLWQIKPEFLDPTQPVSRAIVGCTGIPQARLATFFAVYEKNPPPGLPSCLG